MMVIIVISIDGYDDYTRNAEIHYCQSLIPVVVWLISKSVSVILIYADNVIYHHNIHKYIYIYIRIMYVIYIVLWWSFFHKPSHTCTIIYYYVRRSNASAAGTDKYIPYYNNCVQWTKGLCPRGGGAARCPRRGDDDGFGTGARTQSGRVCK